MGDAPLTALEIQACQKKMDNMGAIKLCSYVELVKRNTVNVLEGEKKSWKILCEDSG